MTISNKAIAQLERLNQFIHSRTPLRPTFFYVTRSKTGRAAQFRYANLSCENSQGRVWGQIKLPNGAWSEVSQFDVKRVVKRKEAREMGLDVEAA